MYLAIALAITVPSIALARESRTHTPVHQCDVVQQTVGVVEQGVCTNQTKRVTIIPQ